MMKPIQDYAAEILERHEKRLAEDVATGERGVSELEDQIVQAVNDLRDRKAQLAEIKAARAKLADGA